MKKNFKQLKYNQIRLEILNYIASRDIRIGDRLPPEREFTKMLNCSSGTMRIALRELEENGLIEKQHGLGSFLKREVSEIGTVGKVLYISVIQEKGNVIHPPAHLSLFFSKHGIRMEHQSITHFGELPFEKASEYLGILLTGWLTDDIVKNFQALQIPTVIVGNYRLETPVPSVSNDMEQLTCRLVEHFAGRGERRIAFWGGDPTYWTLQEAQAGYIRGMKKAGLPWDGLIMEADSLTPCRRLRNFLDREHSVDVFILELQAFYEYCMVFGEDPAIGMPRFGVLPLLPSRTYEQGKNIFFGDFAGNIDLIAGEILLKNFSGNEPLKSVVLPPVLHGIDDDLDQFTIL